MVEVKRYPFTAFVTATVVIAVAIALSLPWVGLEESHEVYDGVTYTWTTRFYMNHYVRDNGASVSYDDEEPMAILMWHETVLLYAWIFAGWTLMVVSLAGLRLMRAFVAWIVAIVSIAAVVNFFANSPSALEGYRSAYGDTIIWGYSSGWLIVLASCIVQVATVILSTREAFLELVNRRRSTEQSMAK